MTQIRKTAEVFTLPIPVDTTTCFRSIINAAKIGEWPAAKHAARAINHIDSLTAALDELLEMMELEGRHNEREYQLARKALSDYQSG